MTVLGIQEFIGYLSGALSGIGNGSAVRISCSEGHPELYNGIKDQIRKTVEERESKIRVIAGPIFCEDENTKSNPLLDLAYQGISDLYIDLIRNIIQYCIIGDRELINIRYHEPLEDSRDVEALVANDDDIDRFLKTERIMFSSSFFEKTIGSKKLKRWDKSNYIVAPRETILDVKRAKGFNFDFMYCREFREVAGELGLRYTEFNYV